MERIIDLKSLINRSWENAVKQREALGQTNRDKASAWIDSLGESFQECFHYEDQRVFWRNNKDNWRDLKLNELLFDVSVCQIGWVKSTVRKTPLPYISKCLWQVESEFSKDSREITKDFSKLVMGRSENQLFVSTYQRGRQQRALSMCSKIASRCNGNLYLCFVEHPEKWPNNPNSPSLFKWEGSGWECL